MIYCKSQFLKTKAEAHFYVSRAYKSGQMFVYRYDSQSGKIYLENLSTNVSIIDPDDEESYAESDEGAAEIQMQQNSTEIL